MVSHHSGRQGEPWVDNIVPWARKPHTQQECIEEWLGSRELHELLAARDALEQQGPEAQVLLRSLVQRDAQKYLSAKKHVRRSAILTGLVILALLGWNITSPGTVGSILIYLLLAFWLTSPCTLSWVEDYRTVGRRLNHAVALLHRTPLSASTAEMIEAMEAGDAQTASLAAESLIQLLPQLSASEGAGLKAQHHLGLRHALRSYDTDLILAILQASDKVLDQTAIPDVQRLTRCPDWFAESEKIQDAARRSLVVLEANSRQQRTLRTLLRPSSVPGRSGEELLRQAAGVPDDAGEEMLRAAAVPQTAVPPEQKLSI